MSAPLPEPLRNASELLGRLPGIGHKSALRLAMTILQWPESEARRLGQAILALRDQLGICSRCGGIAAMDPCPLCQDERRDSTLLCIVPEWDSLLIVEAGGFYHGQYFALGGLLAPGRPSQNLNIDKLQERLTEGEVEEIILALGSTLEAENTATYLKEKLSKDFPRIAISRLAQGMPLGAEVKHMDQETLRQSMRYRQRF